MKRTIKIVVLFVVLFGVSLLFHLFYDPFLYMFDSRSLKVARNDIRNLSDFSYQFEKNNGRFPSTKQELFSSLTDKKKAMIFDDTNRYLYFISSGEEGSSSDVIIAEDVGNYTFRKGGYVSFGKYKLEWLKEERLTNLLNSLKKIELKNKANGSGSTLEKGSAQTF